MPTAEDMVKFTLRGHIQGTQSWSFSLWMRATLTTVPMQQSTLDSYSNSFKTFIGTWCTGVNTLIWGSGTVADTIQVQYFPALAVHASLASPQSLTTASTGTGSALLPAYVACAVSLRSSDPSRGGKGRFFVPVTLATATSSSANQFSTAMTTAMSTTTKTLIDSMNAQSPPSGVSGHRVAVRSISKGHALDVVRIVTDSLPDVQHRRSDKLLAASVVAAVPAP
jgi:hypothetical protein